ncbi:hypothetical protein [Paractinoplanes lichenicola]|uniref:hypothetical protein n=1 Tax=Paractinoplanes lichenicola TaxID=2802976 RepID=UPI001F422182|nr:hypothetical protein [Actinoplanes lichenicola]
MLIADKAYAHDPTRIGLRRRGIRYAIAERSDQIARRATKGSRGGRPPAFGQQVYRQQNAHRPPATPNAPPSTAHHCCLPQP